MDLSPTMKLYLSKIKSAGRLRVGGRYGGHIPEDTANALVKRGLVKIEWQPVFRRRERSPRAMFTVLVETQTEEKSP